MFDHVCIILYSRASHAHGCLINRRMTQAQIDARPASIECVAASLDPGSTAKAAYRLHFAFAEMQASE